MFDKCYHFVYNYASSFLLVKISLKHQNGNRIGLFYQNSGAQRKLFYLINDKISLRRAKKSTLKRVLMRILSMLGLIELTLVLKFRWRV